MALVNKGFALGKRGGSGDAVTEFERVIADYGDDPTPALRKQVAKALYFKGFALGVLGRLEDALTAYQQLIDRYGNDPAVDVRETVAMATAALQKAGDTGRSD